MADYDPPTVETYGNVEELTQRGHDGGYGKNGGEILD
ncbi:lasso RiPP family leader peptide-containing protein [Halobellus marinus]|nr:lasso RiPP family leader peptide-containing protein [Halobellus sp. DFY28]